VQKKVKSLFDNFAAIYGHRWTSSISDPEILKKSMRAWTSSIADLTNEQLHRAMRKFTRCEDWVSISGFRKAALGIYEPSRAWEVRYDDPIANKVWNNIYTIDQKSADARAVFMAKYDVYTEKLLMATQKNTGDK
jgi:hypothetical protein